MKLRASRISVCIRLCSKYFAKNIALFFDTDEISLETSHYAFTEEHNRIQLSQIAWDLAVGRISTNDILCGHQYCDTDLVLERDMLVIEELERIMLFNIFFFTAIKPSGYKIKKQKQDAAL